MSEPELTPALALGADVSVEDALLLLTRGEIQIEGRVSDASNATFYCGITADGVTAACVYKPVAGERPLWDFPDGTLAGREVEEAAERVLLGAHVRAPREPRE